jgi:hypothetical protein
MTALLWVVNDAQCTTHGAHGDLLQNEFKRLAQEAGVKGARVYVDRAVALLAACLRSAKASVA